MTISYSGAQYETDETSTEIVLRLDTALYEAEGSDSNKVLKGLVMNDCIGRSDL